MKHNILLIILLATCMLCMPVGAATCEQWKIVGKTPWGYISEYRDGGFTILGDTLYMVGGGSDPVPATVWRSTDGITWTFISDPRSPLTTRSYYAVTSFNGYLWLYGGIDFNTALGNKSDIWRSSDEGITWSLVNSSAVLPGRAWPGFIEYNNKLWILGGTASPEGMVDWPLFNDTWWSDDGNIWHLANATPAWINRDKPNMVVFDGALWLINGASSFNGGSNETWYTYDGEIWYPGTTAPSYEKRIADTAAAFDNKMWITGGCLNEWCDGYLNSLYSSSDGVTWTLVNASPLYPAAAFTHLVSYKGNLFYYIGTGNFYQCCASGSCGVEPTPTPCVTPSAEDITSDVTMNVQGITTVGIFAAIGVTLLLIALSFMGRRG